VAWTLTIPSPSFASSIEVVPKSSKRERREPPPKAAPAPQPKTKKQKPEQRTPAPSGSQSDERLRAEAPPPPGRFQWKPLPLIGIGASVIAGAVGTGLLIGAAGELDADQFTFDAEERDDGTIDVDITDDFRDAQRSVILKGFGGTFLVSASATMLTISLLELFRRPGR